MGTASFRPVKLVFEAYIHATFGVQTTTMMLEAIGHNARNPAYITKNQFYWSNICKLSRYFLFVFYRWNVNEYIYSRKTTFTNKYIQKQKFPLGFFPGFFHNEKTSGKVYNFLPAHCLFRFCKFFFFFIRGE